MVARNHVFTYDRMRIYSNPSPEITAHNIAQTVLINFPNLEKIQLTTRQERKIGLSEKRGGGEGQKEKRERKRKKKEPIIEVTIMETIYDHVGYKKAQSSIMALKTFDFREICETFSKFMEFNSRRLRYTHSSRLLVEFNFPNPPRC